jgi:nucleotide-binding universal stress UspA family protein
LYYGEEKRMIYKKILVCLDGSQLAEVVVDYAKELAGRLTLDIDLLHVFLPDESNQLPMRQAYVEHMAEKLRVQSEAIRNKTGYKPRDTEIKVRGIVVVGYPADEILKFADANSSDIIMLSTRGRSGIGRWALGGVAEKVIHAAKVPIWLVPSEITQEVIQDQISKRTIVIPLNGSKHAESVLPYALALAKQRGAETSFVIINVSPKGKIPISTSESRGVFMNEVFDGSKFNITEYLNGVVKQIKEAGFEASAEELKGTPTEEIINYISSHPTALIAMGTNGASGLHEMLFSNTTENVVRRIKKIPIFLVKPKE